MQTVTQRTALPPLPTVAEVAFCRACGGATAERVGWVGGDGYRSYRVCLAAEGAPVLPPGYAYRCGALTARGEAYAALCAAWAAWESAAESVLALRQQHVPAVDLEDARQKARCARRDWKRARDDYRAEYGEDAA